jgi:hypothetical protein
MRSKAQLADEVSAGSASESDACSNQRETGECMWVCYCEINQVYPSVDKQGKSRREALLSTSQLDVGLPPSARSRWPPLCCCG